MQPTSPIQIPAEVAVMSLPNAVLFPRTIMPLYIFEPRYRKMLRHALENHRMFALAAHPPRIATDAPELQQVATLGMVRASHENSDGTSHIVLEGVQRIRVIKVLAEKPYRVIHPALLASEAGAPIARLHAMRIRLLQKLGGMSEVNEEIMVQLRRIEHPEIFIDLAAYSLCQTVEVKQAILAHPVIARRYEILSQYLTQCDVRLALYKELQGQLPDEQISFN